MRACEIIYRAPVCSANNNARVENEKDRPWGERGRACSTQFDRVSGNIGLRHIIVFKRHSVLINNRVNQGVTVISNE